MQRTVAELRGDAGEVFSWTTTNGERVTAIGENWDDVGVQCTDPDGEVPDCDNDGIAITSWERRGLRDDAEDNELLLDWMADEIDSGVLGDDGTYRLYRTPSGELYALCDDGTIVEADEAWLDEEDDESWYYHAGAAYCSDCVECDSPAVDPEDCTRGPAPEGWCACCNDGRR